MREDGDFVLMANQHVIWNTNTSNGIDLGIYYKYGRLDLMLKGCGFRLALQNNGILVINDEDGKQLWASSNQQKGEYLVLENNGDLVLYDFNDMPVWSSDSKRSRRKKTHIKTLIFNIKILVCLLFY